MTTLRQQATDMLGTMPEDVLLHLIQYMQDYQNKKRETAQRKMNDFMNTCATQEKPCKLGECLRSKYGSITAAISGILPPIYDRETAKERTLREKYAPIA